MVRNKQRDLPESRLNAEERGFGWGYRRSESRVAFEHVASVHNADFPVCGSRGISRPRFRTILKCSIPIWFVSIATVFLAGCSEKVQAPTSQAAPAWSWSPYPAAEKMRLATLPCQVMPRTSLTINAPVSGQLRLYIDRPQTNLPAGFLWGEFEPKSLSLEASELAEARQRISERERLFEQIDLPNEQIKL